MQCPQCQTELVAHEKSSSVSAAGLFGALVGLVGLLTMFANALLGVGILIAGLLIGMARRKRLVLICPACKHQVRVA